MRRVMNAGRSPKSVTCRRRPVGVDSGQRLLVTPSSSANLADLDLHRHPHVDLIGRAWKLRDNVSAYDAMYVAQLGRGRRLNTDHAPAELESRREAATLALKITP